ncbi:MAG: outer membrane protein assembly factor BamB [Burkholderiales bacterium]
MARQLLAALAAVAVLGGCASAPSGPKPATLTPIHDAQAVRILWSAKISPAGRFVFSPALAGDGIFVAGRDGTVARLDPASGETRWRVDLNARLSGGVGSDGRLVVVASDEGVVFALDAKDGRILWRARVSSEVLAAPAVGDGLVLVRSADSRVFAFGSDDGKRRWVYQRAPASLIVRASAGLSIDGDTAYAGFSGGKLVAIALQNGGLRWEATVAVPHGATELERVTDVEGVPVAQGREVCAAAYQGRVACFDARNGNPIWSRAVSSVTGVSLDARYAYVSDDQGAVYAFDRTDGRSVWKQDKLANRQTSLPLPLGSEIAVGDLEGYVHFLARESGAFVARIATDGGPIRAAPIKLPSGLLVQTLDGGLYALGL